MSLYLDKILKSRIEVCFPREGAEDSESMSVNDFDSKDVTDKMQGILKKSNIFDITNVAAYFYVGTPQDSWQPSDLPHPMPPFKSMWMEWKMPVFCQTDKGIKELDLGNWFSRVGCLVQHFTKDEFIEQVGESAAEKLFDRICSTMIEFTVIPEFRGGCPKVIVWPTVVIGLDSNYEIRPICDNGTDIGSGFLFVKVPGRTDDDYSHFPIWMDSVASVSEKIMFPSILAMSMLNCRNVVTRSVSVPPRLLKSHKRKGHSVTPSHHVIEIQPMVDAVRAATGCAGHSREAASIVRGHFKKYAGKGLFGKYQGLFWWDAQDRSKQTAEYRMKSSSGPLDLRWKEQVEEAKLRSKSA